MQQLSTKREYTEQTGRPKKSILRRWAITNAIFFFVAFVFFAVIIYLVTISSFIDNEKSIVISSMDAIETQLKKANQSLTIENLDQYFNYLPNSNGQTIETPRTITSIIGSKNQLFIYSAEKNLIFSTDGNVFPFFEDTKNSVRTETVETAVGTYKGYLESRPIISEETGEIVGHIQSFYNLDDYYQLQERLILSLIGIVVFAIMAAIIFGYLMADHFIRPLRQLSDSMEKVAMNPDKTFEPVVIRQDDEIKQIGDFYNEMMERVNATIDYQKRFVSNVSHELRTPLTIIDGNLNMILRWGFNNLELVEENIRISHKEAMRMNAILKDMLDLSRLESLSEKYHTAVCDVGHAASDMARNFQIIHEDFEISFVNKLSDIAYAQISENHYAQMITILIENAIKYSMESRKIIQLKLMEDENFIITCVSDRGVGISEEDAEHIFERFFRADKARNREIGGSGLGLPILADILKFYQGEITLDSEPDVGTTFTLKIPKVK